MSSVCAHLREGNGLPQESCCVLSPAAAWGAFLRPELGGGGGSRLFCTLQAAGAWWAPSPHGHVTHPLRILPFSSSPNSARVAGPRCWSPPFPRSPSPLVTDDQMEACPSPLVLGPGSHKRCPAAPTLSLSHTRKLRVPARFAPPPSASPPPPPPPHPLFKECQGSRWARQRVWKACPSAFFFFSTSEIEKEKHTHNERKRKKRKKNQ